MDGKSSSSPRSCGSRWSPVNRLSRWAGGQPYVPSKRSMVVLLEWRTQASARIWQEGKVTEESTMKSPLPSAQPLLALIRRSIYIHKNGKPFRKWSNRSISFSIKDRQLVLERALQQDCSQASARASTFEYLTDDESVAIKTSVARFKNEMGEIKKRNPWGNQYKCELAQVLKEDPLLNTFTPSSHSETVHVFMRRKWMLSMLPSHFPAECFY